MKATLQVTLEFLQREEPNLQFGIINKHLVYWPNNSLRQRHVLIKPDYIKARCFDWYVENEDEYIYKGLKNNSDDFILVKNYISVSIDSIIKLANEMNK